MCGREDEVGIALLGVSSGWHMFVVGTGLVWGDQLSRFCCLGIHGFVICEKRWNVRYPCYVCSSFLYSGLDLVLSFRVGPFSFPSPFPIYFYIPSRAFASVRLSAFSAHAHFIPC